MTKFGFYIRLDVKEILNMTVGWNTNEIRPKLPQMLMVSGSGHQI